MRRRELFALFLGLLAQAGCGAPAQNNTRPAPSSPPLPKLHAQPLDTLLPIAGLRWLLVGNPSEWAALPWLKPAVAEVIKDSQFHRFASATGLELRAMREAAAALYTDEKNRESMVYLGAPAKEPAAIEQAFLKRLTSHIHRAQDRPDLIRLSGKVGNTFCVLALLGREAFVYQVGGSPNAGPARIAALYAEQKLKRSPTALAPDVMKRLSEHLGPAPLRAFAPGPFEGELARGARGLLAGSEALGAAVRPSAREGLGLSIAVAGDFSRSAQDASNELRRAWDELAHGSFGHLLGLDQPVTPPLSTHAPDFVGLYVELHPMKLARGLASATSRSVEEIMR